MVSILGKNIHQGLLNDDSGARVAKAQHLCYPICCQLWATFNVFASLNSRSGREKKRSAEFMTRSFLFTSRTKPAPAWSKKNYSVLMSCRDPRERRSLRKLYASSRSGKLDKKEDLRWKRRFTRLNRTACGVFLPSVENGAREPLESLDILQILSPAGKMITQPGAHKAPAAPSHSDISWWRFQNSSEWKLAERGGTSILLP